MRNSGIIKLLFIPVILLMLIPFIFILAEYTRDNIQTIGDGGTSAHKAFCVNQGNNLGSRPCLRWNSASSSWEISNDGTNYSGVGAPSPIYFTHTNDPNTTHAITAGNREYVVIASSAGGTSTVTLPAANTVTGQRILIRRTGSHSHDNRRVLITSTSTITDASSSIDLWRTGAWIDFYSDGTNYVIVDSDRKFGGYELIRTVYNISATSASTESIIIGVHSSSVGTNIRLTGRINHLCYTSDFPTIGNLRSINFANNSNGIISAVESLSFSDSLCNTNRQIFGLITDPVQVSGYYKICLLNIAYYSYRQYQFINLIINGERNIFSLDAINELSTLTASGCVKKYLQHNTSVKAYFSYTRSGSGNLGPSGFGIINTESERDSKAFTISVEEDSF